ncbi:NACHT domain-containing protein [Fusarium sp. LHS14.1]|nr:NACHT domain-containing protein [Fusarium sp. LHS14.1]
MPTPPSIVEIMESFKKVIAKYDRVFFVVDALDECAAEDRTGFLKEIFRLQTISNVSLFATFRSDVDLEHMLGKVPSLEILADPEDVRSYLEWGMHELPAFVKQDPALKEEIKDTIIKATPGSFLAAALQLKFLAAMSPSEDPRATLEGVARDSASAHYDALYEAIMRRVESQAPGKATLARKTLSYMACARSPWTAAELCHALTVKVGDTQLDSNAMPSLQAIMAACSGMMVAISREERDEDDETENLHKDGDSDEAAIVRLDRIAVRLVHRTAHEYLQRTSKRWLSEKDKLMATSCMAYLSLHYFSDGSCADKGDLELRLRIFPLYYYAALHWESHARVALQKFPHLASINFEFLGSGALIESACYLMSMVGQWPRDEDYVGGYPHGMNGLHITAFFGIVDLVRAMGKSSSTMVNTVDEWGFTPLAWAAKKGHEETVKAILKFTAIDVDIRDSHGRTSISLAAGGGHTAIVEMLLNYGSNQNFKDIRRATPLWHAAKGGHTTTVALLIKWGVDLNVSSAVETPLSMAAMEGNEEMISLLLSQPNIQPRTKVWPIPMDLYTPCTALGVAVWRGNTTAVEILLSSPDIAAAAGAGEDGELLLHSSVYHGFEDITRLLLSIDININTQCEEGKTPLHLAISRFGGGDDGIARLLLSQAEVMLDLADTDGNTPALLATSRGRIGVLRLLLAKGVDIEARNEDGLTLLGVAAGKGFLAIVELLLATDGVDADSRDAIGRTPFALAAINPSRKDHLRMPWDPDCVQDNYGVIQCLLDSGRVDINSRDDLGQTPLMHATRGHRHDLPSFRLLLNHEGLDLDVVDNKGQTALSQAVIMRKEYKATLLLGQGANPNLVRLGKGETLLSHAAGHGMIELVRALISHGGVDVQEQNADGHTAFCRAAAGDQVRVLELLLGVEGADINASCDHGQTPLHHAAEAREGEEVASLLLAKGNPDLDAQDFRGRTPLHCATELGSEALVSLLLDDDVPNVDCRDLEGRTSLSLAAQQGRLQIVEKLLSLESVSPDARDISGRTPLSWAGHSTLTDVSAIIKRLLDTESVDPNAEDQRGWTPLSWAVQANRASDLVEVLLVEGAKRININHEDRRGRTPLALALERGHEVVVGQLRAAGAREKWLNEYPISLAIDEDEKQYGTDTSLTEPGGPVCEKEAEAPKKNEEGSQIAFSEDGFSTDSLERDRWQRERRRWLSPNWFDDTVGDDNGNERDIHNHWRFEWPSIEIQIKLGAQNDVPGGDEGKDVEGLCFRCKALDLDQLFSRCPPAGFRAIENLGKVDQSWESGSCAMCRLLEAVCPRGGTEDSVLCAYSSTAKWLSRGSASAMHYFMSNWVDTVILSIDRRTSDFIYFSKDLSYRSLPMAWRHNEDILRYGFISRIGSNDRHRLRSLTVHRLQADQVDIERARGWIACCAAYHGRRCNPSIRQPTTSFRLIDFVKDSVWWTRGWTFQEGVLSRRRLIFTEHEVSYECQCMVARECVEVPQRVHRISATKYSIHDESALFSQQSGDSDHGASCSIWSQIEEYTERHLTHDYDILNAMLGVMEVAAERKDPVYHLCGVPIDLGSFSETGGLTLLERFLAGLCWSVSSGTRREGFPSWSWTGWKGRAHRPNLLSDWFKSVFPIEVSMVPRDDPSAAVSWADFEAMGPKEKAALPQDYIIEITGFAVDVSIRYNKVDPSYVILCDGDDVRKGFVVLCKDPERDASFLHRLAEERLRAVVVGHSGGYNLPLILLALAKVGDYWERIGVINLASQPELDVHGGVCTRQTFLIR